MAVDQSTAQSYFNSQPQSTKDAVAASGGTSPEHILAWFQAAVNAGDPSAVAAAGGSSGAGATQAEEGGNIASYQGAAPASEWLGKRKPTAQELRRWAADTNRSENYARFPDAAVSGWIDRNWDVQAGSFKNDYGDLVDKPDERGPNTPAGYNGTGDRGGWDTGGTGAPASPEVASSATSNDPLQARLLEMYGGGEGNFAGKTGSAAQDLEGGGVWWSGPEPLPAGVSPALADATLNAFSPEAPSKGVNLSGGLNPVDPNAYMLNQSTPVNSAAIVSPQASRSQPTSSANPTPAPAVAANAGENPLNAAVNRRYKNPNLWWAGQ